MNIVTTRKVTCPKCQKSVEMSLDYIRGSGQMTYCCPSCNGVSVASEMQKSGIPGGPAPLTEGEIRQHASEFGHPAY